MTRIYDFSFLARTTTQIANVFDAGGFITSPLGMMATIDIALPWARNCIPTGRSKFSCCRHAWSSWAVVCPAQVIGLTRITKLHPIVKAIPYGDPIVIWDGFATIDWPSFGCPAVWAQLTCIAYSINPQCATRRSSYFVRQGVTMVGVPRCKRMILWQVVQSPLG